MRRLLPLVCGIVFVDTMLFAAVIPLVPAFVEDHDLSKLGAGVLVGAYGAGAVLGGIPGGLLADRLGPRTTTVLGLLTLAVASVAFALAGEPLSLGLSRLAQGLASAVTWAGALAWLTLATPRERRGQTLGTAFGFAVLGFIVGPVVGAIAVLTSVTGTFLAVAMIVVGFAVVAGAFPQGRSDVRAAGALARALRDRGLLAAVWLTLVPALFFGALDVLVPLALDDAGWGTVAIAATFVAAGLVEVALAPALGALSDQRGRLYPVRLSLWGLAAVSLALSLSAEALLVAALVVAAAVAASGISTPSIALVADRAEANRLPQGLAFGVMNSTWAAGAMIGPAGGGALADAVGDAAPYLLSSAIAVATVVLVVGRGGQGPRPA